jgi:transcriptional regulator with XRE-family HTH domain
MSDIELGHRNPPSQEKILKIAEALEADPAELIDLAAKTKKKVEFDLEGVQPHRAEMALMLARSWNGLNDEDIEKIKDILQGGGK